MKTKVITVTTIAILLASILLTVRSNVSRVPSSAGKFSVDPYTLALWHFDEGEGQIVYDQSSHHNDGTLGPTSNAEDRDPSWVSGFTGMAGDYALSFDDWYDYVLVPDNPDDSLDLLHGDQFTIEFWTYVRQVSRADRGNGQHWNHFIYKFTRPEPRQGYSISQSSTYPVVSGNFYNGTAPDSESPAVQCEPPPTHVWLHFMFTYDGQYLRIYFNGTLQNESEVGHQYVAGNDLPLSIGKSLFEDTPWNDAVDCIIDEVRISSIPRDKCIDVTWGVGTPYCITVSCENPITSFSFKPGYQLNFTVVTDDSGFCNITIPRCRLDSPFSVKINETITVFDMEQNETDSTLILTYASGTHHVEIKGTERGYIVGDINKDGKVDILDIALAAMNFGNKEEDYAP